MLESAIGFPIEGWGEEHPSGKLDYPEDL